ncbi:MAG: carbamoyltransferase HypF [Acidobacteria bacterium]|nr:carbamoyltransferase HypF [Acidobacteriota bacterium]
MAASQVEGRASTSSDRPEHVEGRAWATSARPEPVVEGRRIRIQGTVQGVGFRPWVHRMARVAGVTGRVWNDSAGVTIEVFGDDARLGRFIEALHLPPPAARIAALDYDVIPPEPAADFVIVPSHAVAERRVSIPPELATCDDCVAEIFDPASRRYRYPFTNCTNCGPRFTIARDIPYDRATTTMAPFEMCPACQREYDDVGNRRFHAQPNACPVCGPRLTLRAHDGRLIDVDDPIAAAAEALRLGLIVAVKGIGGFHLACDATSDEAVRILRQRKHRDEKPLAVMVRALGDAEALVEVDDEARRLLTSVERPIVLLPRRVHTASAELRRVAKDPPYDSQDPPCVSEAVAPRNRLLGVFLPYSPLHHLLVADAGRPLVMTSGNLSDEPIAYANDEAVGRLGDIADLFLLHDREIVTRADDSVVSVIDGRGTVLRRSRGYVPRAVTLARGVARPVLACGALLKNTFCIATGASAWLGPHIGDLENVETYESYTTAIARLERFLQVQPAVIAHDLHPDYLSTTYAKRRPEAITIAVQHHHAHVVSAMAEHGLDGRVIGIAYDGTGYGTDGTMWGGEVLVASAAGFERAATFRPIALAGGDRAIREPWRIALALVLDACDGVLPDAAVRLLAEVPVREIDLVRQFLGGGGPAPLARGVGRYFDGFGALFLGRARANFEGQVALEWNQAADPHVGRSYRFALDERDGCWEIDLRRAVCDALFDRVHGDPVSAIAAAFHNTLADATAAVVRLTVERVGALPIVASGGCFQNARLAESVRAALAPEHDVLLHRSVPPGDGGIALGQAVIADAVART